MTARLAIPALAVPLAAAALAGLAVAAPGHRADPAARPAADHANMSDDEMRRWAEQWWATHPRVGTPSRQAANATFTVTNFRFDRDGSGATQVDTAKIAAGESVTWQWVTGFHTVTSGTAGSPSAGSLFDQPSDAGHPQFTFVFEEPGTYHFFCRPHEFNNMRGVVVVSSTTGVPPAPGRTHGFTVDPAPNPSREGARFGFAMRSGGRARAEVFDTRGRRVAAVLDRELPAGDHEGVWNGRSADGAAVRAGVYYVRLRLPGYSDSRSIVILR